MYEVKSLEDDWKRYRSKKRRPFFLFFLLLSIGSASIGYLYEQKISLENVKTYMSKYINISSLETSVEKLNLLDSLIVTQGLNKLAREEVENPTTTSTALVDIPILDMENKSIFNPKNSEKSGEVEEKLQLNIIGTSSVVAYKDVEKRFEKNHDIDDALFLAKSYYKKGNYEKAAYWALETNKLDDDVEESILIFVEAKVKSGQINEGLSILKKYINQSASVEAKKLLFRIENN
jgi:hypothetical protein